MATITVREAEDTLHAALEARAREGQVQPSPGVRHGEKRAVAARASLRMLLSG
ncbi:MAG: hypothetical protein OXE86_18120 [Alphaproteobacteria bacterium]|nr:hypothetical protein [Alphaproteobacteria bacterium]